MTKKAVRKEPPPKKTGKRGIGPLDVDKDFNESVKKDVGKQEALPGMEDRELTDLEDAARNYVAVRDRRMALTDQEVDLKGVLLNAMHRHKRVKYHRDGILIEVKTEKETVRVKIKDEE